MIKRILKPFAFALLVLIYSCVGEDFIEVEPTQSPRVVIFGSSSSLDSILVGSSRQYTATYFNGFGFATDQSISWSSENSSIVQLDGNGKATGLSNGFSQIYAISGGLTASQSVIVYSIERVEINSPKSFTFVNDSLQLTATYYDSDNMPQNAAISWTSSIPSVASIDANGLVRGLQKGQSFITASANGIQSFALLLNVIEDSSAVATITIIKDTAKINVGDQFLYEAEVRNGFGDLMNETVEWSSSDSTVLRINNNGLATALKAGSSNITANASGVFSAISPIAIVNGLTGRRSGSFQNENGYSVSGNVEVRPSAGNNFELAFTNFNCQPGPALYIHLSNSVSAGVEIGTLNQLNGDFTVQLPANILLNDYDYVLIWCKSANAAFGSARLN